MHEFEQLWVEVKPKVMVFCRRHAPDLERAEDLYGTIVLKALRGFPDFRRDCSFRTWVLRIATNAWHAQARRQSGLTHVPRDVRLEVCSLDALLEDNPSHGAVATVATSADAFLGWGGLLPGGAVQSIINGAVEGGFLKDGEAQALLHKLEHPEQTNEQAGQDLGITGTTFATRRCRASSELRVYVLSNFGRLFGSSALLEEALRSARCTDHNPLTPAEAQVFENLVLGRQPRWRMKGWKGLRQAACDKVMRHLRI